MNAKHAIIAVALIVPMSSAFGQENECSPPPCDLKTDGRAKCEMAADWVIEGELGSVTDEYGQSCGDCEPKFRWTGATLILSKPKGIKLTPDALFKGAIAGEQFGAVRIASSSRCWEKNIRMDLKAIDKIVRFYGTDKQGPYPLAIKPGYFAYEVIGEPDKDAK
jgi:hypothetical protein